MNGKSLACWLMVATICPQVLIVGAPGRAEVLSQVASRITDINTTTSGDRLNLILNFAGSDRPEITYRSQGKAWIAELNGAQLQLGNGNASFAKTNPAPGISAIEAKQTGANKVDIRVTISDPEMLKSSVIRRNTSTGLMFTVATATPTDKNQTNNLAIAKPTVLAQAKPAPQETQTTTNGQLSTAPSSQVLTSNTSDGKPTTIGQAVIQPEVSITSPDGKTRVAQTTVPPDAQVPPAVTSPVQPQLPGRTQGVVPPFRRLNTPPVGDIAVSTVRLRPDLVDLASAERVPRISLRNAPAIEVLTLIGRVAGLSVVSAEGGAASGGATPTATPGATATGGLNQLIPVLDIENETAQEVFNNILRITGLQANRIGRTIFVATKLPVSLQNLVTRSYRLNQITVGDASAFLVGLGAERVVTRQRPIPGIQAATTVGAGGTVAVAPVQLETVPVVETLSGTTDSTKTILKGLQVIAEERSNSVTLIGAPKLVEFAEAQLGRLDIRKRQVSVNVRVVEVQLSDNQTFGGSFAFSPNNTTGGGTTSSINSNGGTTPNTLAINFNNIASALTTPQQFVASLNAQIATNRGKVITDPTLTIQEGETATVSLTDDVVSKVETTVTVVQGAGNTFAQTITITKAGLVLNIRVLRVDDNGFINLSVAPFVSTPIGQQTFPTGNGGSSFVTLISERKLESGQVRLRDGQTLILSGVIRDSDRNTVNKVPILGDLPIIGALFRSENTVNSRSEVIVVVTPRVIDDSERANWGYTYQPGPEVQKVLDSNRIKPQ